MANQMINPDNHEIDLAQVSRKAGRVLSRVNDSFFDGILFIKRNIIILIILLIAGVALGFYFDRSSKVYKHKITVIPNFGSVDYLYSEIEQLNTKIRDNDQGFLKQLGIKNTNGIGLIEVKPVVDIYNFINGDISRKETDRNFETFKMISETGDMKKMLIDNITSRNYKTHIITITTGSEKNVSELIDPILNYLNSNNYYKKIQQESIINIDEKIKATNLTIAQVDGILNNFGKISDANNGNSDVYYSITTELDKVIAQKNKLLELQKQNNTDKINYTKIIKDSNVISNERNFTTTGLMKYILPILFIVGYLIVFAFRSYYKSQINKRKLIANGQQ